MKHEPYGIYERLIKRPLDAVSSLLALIILSPLMAVTAVLVGIKLGRPVLFVQERPGRYEKLFKLYKFRTMTDERDEEGKLLPDKDRLTKFGRFLRSTSIDELPELVNILKGDMSLVGPRPLIVTYLAYYDSHQARRHEVRPGLTGLAQIHGRNLATWEDRFDRDVEYVDNITFATDLRIIMATVMLVLRHEGISSETSATMEGFRGSGKKNTGKS